MNLEGSDFSFVGNAPPPLRVAITALAKRNSTSVNFVATLPLPYLIIDGRRIAVDTLLIKPSNKASIPSRKPRLRDDKVAQRVLEIGESIIESRTPDGLAVVFTVSSPIKLPGRLISAFDDIFASSLIEKSISDDVRFDVVGNRVRLRVVSNSSLWKSKAIGFVFSGDPLPSEIVDATDSFQRQVDALTANHTPQSAISERLLVVEGTGWFSDIKCLFRTLNKMQLPGNYTNIITVFGDRVEEVASRSIS